MIRLSIMALLCAALAGCNAATMATKKPTIRVQQPEGAQLSSQSELIEQEHADRIHRIRRLADKCDVPAPSIDQQLLLPKTLFDTDRDLPVIRVAWGDRAFFDTDEATPLASSEPILCVLAGVLEGDLPDTHLAVVGHTDARGSKAYNEELSLARARNVTQRLVERGVRPQQADYIGMGKLQPVAPNNTPEGMAKNRRVEFFLGAYPEITLEAVSRVPVNEEHRELAETHSRERQPASVGKKRSVQVHTPASRDTDTVDQSRKTNVESAQRQPDAGEAKSREITVGGRQRSLDLPAVVHREPAIGSRRSGF
ncbi:OmpA family protein [Halomonas garicola]|uniref:OmpA family protein n=1 Tax=Halomonas garicola TaxID=1690008 RepID=UPI0028A0C723|nr:OmpA family protein [Halomonas garicola]